MSQTSFTSLEMVGTVLVAKPEREKIGEYESPILRAEIEARAPGAKWRIVVDLCDVRMVASAGLGCLMSLSKACKEKGGKFALCGLDPQVREVFELTKLHRVLTIADSRDGAIKGMSEH